MTTATQKDQATQIYRVFIDATPEAIWNAITSPDWNSRYGYHAETEYDLRPGGAYRVLAPVGDPSHDSTQAIIEGEVIESDPPRKLVQTWHALFSPETAAEPFTQAHVGDRSATERHVDAHSDPRSRRHADHGGLHGRIGPGGRRRLGLDHQRSQDIARDRERDRRLTDPEANWRGYQRRSH